MKQERQVGIVVATDIEEVNGEIELTADVLCFDKTYFKMNCGKNYFVAGNIVRFRPDKKEFGVQPTSHLSENENKQISELLSRLKISLTIEKDRVERKTASVSHSAFKAKTAEAVMAGLDKDNQEIESKQRAIEITKQELRQCNLSMAL